jgi:tetratricopeptide (TPR) repeat protein
MGNWLIALKGGKLLKESSSFDLMWEPLKLNNGQIRGFNQLTNGYALGWPTVSRSSHPGAAPVGGERSALFVYGKDDSVNSSFNQPDGIKKLRLGLLSKGFDKTEQVLTLIKKDDPAFQLRESELNGWGYKLLSQKKVTESAAIFRLNVKLYPQSANAYGSLGEIMKITGNNSEALINYKRSLELDPVHKNAKERIKILLKS